MRIPPIRVQQEATGRSPAAAPPDADPADSAQSQKGTAARRERESPALLLSGHPLLAGQPSSSCPAWGVSRPRIRRLEADDQIGSGARIAPCAQCNLMLVRSWRHKKVKPMGNSGLLDDA